MKSTIFGDKRKLIRQTIAAWLILLFSTILFTLTSVLLSFITNDSQIIILLSTLLISLLIIWIFSYLQHNSYQIIFARDTSVGHLSESKISSYDVVKRIVDL